MFNKLKTALKKKGKKEEKSADASPISKTVKMPELSKDFKAEDFDDCLKEIKAIKESVHQLDSQLTESETNYEQKVDEISQKNEQLETYKQHCEHLQSQVHSLMEENERTLKVNTALLYKTKILEEDIKQRNTELQEAYQKILEQTDSAPNEIESLDKEETEEAVVEAAEPPISIDAVEGESQQIDIAENNESASQPEQNTNEEPPVSPSAPPATAQPEEAKQNEVVEAAELSTPTAEPSMQTINDKKTIGRLNNRIKELEILIEAEKGGVIVESKNKQIAAMEQKYANLEGLLDQKDKDIKQLQLSLVDLHTKHETTFNEKNKFESMHKEIKESTEAKVKELEGSLSQTKISLETKEKLHESYQKKITGLLDEKEELLNKIETLEKKEKELTDVIDHCQGKDNKKDKIYTRMLKNKDKTIHKMTMEIDKLQNAEKSRIQTVEYFKKRVQILEKESNSKDCERCRQYSKRNIYKDSNVVDYDVDLNNHSEKNSEIIDESHQKESSPKNKSVINFGFGNIDDDFIELKPNQIEKLSMDLDNCLKEPINQNLKIVKSKSVDSNKEDSISMKEEIDEYSDVFNEKMKKDIDTLQLDLKLLRIDYDNLAQQNLSYKKDLIEKTDLCNNLEITIDELKLEINQYLEKEKNSEKEIIELNRRRDLAKTEILSLNSKLEMLSSKISSTDTSKSIDLDHLNDEKLQELNSKIEKLQKVLTHNSNLMIRINKSVVDVYKDFINLLIQAEESNSSSKKLFYDLERKFNGLKMLTRNCELYKASENN